MLSGFLLALIFEIPKHTSNCSDASPIPVKTIVAKSTWKRKRTHKLSF
jgi:hypothetical protein